jgi:hypothetical protein
VARDRAAAAQQDARRTDLIERFFSKLKHFRGVATRYEGRRQLPRDGPVRLNAAVAALMSTRPSLDIQIQCCWGRQSACCFCRRCEKIQFRVILCYRLYN